MNAVEWADAGLEALRDELRLELMPCDLEKAALYIRAAYGKGYQDSLEAVEPLIVLDALEFRDELALRVPVF